MSSWLPVPSQNIRNTKQMKRWGEGEDGEGNGRGEKVGRGVGRGEGRSEIQIRYER